MDSTRVSNPTFANPSKRILHVVSLNHAVNDASTSLISTLFPVVLAVFRFSIFEVGVLVASGYLTNVICQPITGHYSEKIEPRKLLALGISLMGISMVSFVFSTTFPLMLFSVVLLRVGSSFFHPVGVSAVSKAYVGSQLDRAMGFQSAFGNFGIFIVFMISAPLYLTFGWQFPFVSFAGLCMIVVLVTLAGLGKFPTLPHRTNDDKETGRPANITNNRERRRLRLPLFFIISMFISGGAYAVVLNFGNILLKESGFTVPQANILMAVWIGSAFMGALATGSLTKVITRGTLVPVSYIAAFISTLTFALFTENVELVVLSLIVNGFALSVTYPAIYAELSSFLGYESEKKGASFGILFSSQIIGSSIMGFLSGYVSTIFGLTFPFRITAMMMAIAAVSAYIWSKKSRSIKPTIGH